MSFVGKMNPWVKLLLTIHINETLGLRPLRANAEKQPAKWILWYPEGVFFASQGTIQESRP